MNHSQMAFNASQEAIPAAAITYLCGDCGSSVDVRPADAIRCRECGCRVLYKMRARKPMVYEAR